METQVKTLKIVVAVALQDAGEATRSVEIAKGIRENCPPGWQVEFTFLSHGSRFEDRVLDEGFKVYHCQPALEGRSVREDLKMQFPEVVGDSKLACDMLRGEVKALEELRPDLVLHGFWPFASVGRRMVEPPISGICFLPLPLYPSMMGSPMLKDVPDQVKPLTYLPLALRRRIVRMIPKAAIRRAPNLKQRKFLAGVEMAGWEDDPLRDLFELLEADLTLVNDLPDYYATEELPANFRLTGPLFAPAEDNVVLDPAIEEVFDPQDKRPKIFVTMGSSGTKHDLLEVIRALSYGRGRDWNAVVLAPPSICSLDEARACAGERPRMYITDKFVPAPAVNALAHVVISHGGQGTVQTALACGTPVVGVAMQLEQQINLDNVAANGAAIRIPLHQWKAERIQAAVAQVLADPLYRQQAQRLQQRVLSMDGKKQVAEAVWDFITAKFAQATPDKMVQPVR